jgi:hypothetical protein
MHEFILFVKMKTLQIHHYFFFSINEDSLKPDSEFELFYISTI